MIVAIDTETTGVDWDDELFAISWSTSEGSWYVDVRQDYETIGGLLGELTILLHWTDCEYVFHNCKFDLHKLIKRGIINYEWVEHNIHRIHDTQILANLHDSYAEVALKDCARLYLGETTDEAKVLNAWFRTNKIKKAEGYDKLPPEILKPYAIKDAEFTLGLFNYFYPKLSPGQLEFYRTEMEFVGCLLEIEAAGLATRQDFIETTIRSLSAKIDSAHKIIKREAGDEFNPNSPKQILEWLTERKIKADNTQFVTLEKLDIPMIRAIIDMRKAKKLRDTYFIPMRGKNPMHISLQPVSRTGRMKGSELG